MGESEPRYIALVDTYAFTQRLAPAFRDAGYIPIRVQSTEQVPRFYQGHADPFPYTADIVHCGDPGETASLLAPYRPVAVVPGGEVGVELADILSEALQEERPDVPSNGTALSSARRDKYVMVERIKAQGLRGAEQILVQSEDELHAWHASLSRRVIIKPLRSGANDGVMWCDTPDDSVRAFRRMSRRENIFSESEDGVVAQEYLVGTEYFVNTVSRDGLHHVCDIWKTHCISVNGKNDLKVASQLLPCTGEAQDQLVPYAYEVLDALGIRHGPAHSEIKLTPDGPCLVEVGARIAGVDLPGYAHLATGESQIDWTVDAYVRPDRFQQRHARRYELRANVACARMVAPRSGQLVSYRGLNAIKTLESLRELNIHVKPGEWISQTVDDTTYPVVLTLMHEVEEVLLRDLNTLRYIDGEGFYDLAGEAISPALLMR
ncbi:ATP-grasp domain-containing protein [Streptomyces sp. NPDC059003]|uniref:ATP-grasp domain-containing protein n=1 Tax=Streptomyces sp. NPDC059003 TaxID=3346691 RepID=UPI0036A3CB3D